MSHVEESEIFLQDLLDSFESAQSIVNSKWDAFKLHLERNKSNWSDSQYFYFHKRVEEIEQGLEFMNKQIDGGITDYIEDNLTHYRNILNK